ncbi:MAG: hypothetical protein M1830_003771, partial [Pleopsidium flavum]
MDQFNEQGSKELKEDDGTISFPLSKLPSELCIKIFECALVRDRVCPYLYRKGVSTEIIYARKPPGHCAHTAVPMTNLLLTCRTIYKQTVAILYGQNQFQFEDPVKAYKFILLRRYAFQKHPVKTLVLRPNYHFLNSHPDTLLLRWAARIQSKKIENHWKSVADCKPE